MVVSSIHRVTWRAVAALVVLWWLGCVAFPRYLVPTTNWYWSQSGQLDLTTIRLLSGVLMLPTSILLVRLTLGLSSLLSDTAKNPQVIAQTKKLGMFACWSGASMILAQLLLSTVLYFRLEKVMFYLPIGAIGVGIAFCLVGVLLFGMSSLFSTRFELQSEVDSFI
ncbi:MAG TPA: hypothetical protein VK171_16505 [Fimbriimonas sp.]|nr:hypothetical protein [Fimbriimonas sp.]